MGVTVKRCTIPAMRSCPEDLMRPDLSSEIVPLGSGGLIFVSLLVIVAAPLTRA